MSESIHPRGVLNRADFAAFADELHEQKRRIVFTNGVFDILHVGHLRYLQAAAHLGDVLMVGINSDASVKRLKGDSRPINFEEERAELLAALDCVTAVTIFDEDTPQTLIESVRPDIHSKGGDYASADILPETPLVRQLGGDVVILPLVPGRSTTRLIALLEGEKSL